MSKTYSAESIQSLTFIEGVRSRVGMYLGSANNEGVIHGLIEIVNNSLDESIMGYGNKIIIDIGKEWYSVEDFGRGIPVGSNKQVDDVLANMLTSSHSGGKFDHDNYERVRGLNGLGIGIVSASADKFEVISYREGNKWVLTTIKGEPQGKTKSVGKSSKTGTKVTVYPSPEVFVAEPIKLDFDVVSEIIKEYAYFSPNCEFILNDKVKGRQVKYRFKNGLKDFAKDMIKQPLHKNYIYHKLDENGIEVEVIAQWTKGKESLYTFVNGGSTPEGGTPTTGLRSAITTRVNSELGKKLSGDVIRKGLVAIISIKHPNPIFGNQTKTKISNPELRGLTSQAILAGLEDMKRKSTKEYELLLEAILKIDKAERAGEKAREAILSMKKDLIKSTNRKGIDLPDKVVDATNKTGYRELYISEGDSAIGYLKSTRDAATQAVMPLRGKILNTYDMELHEAYENEEVQAIFTLLGSGAGSVYNPKKLRYDKVIIATDMDPDGDHISLLLIGLFLEHTPQLIQDGKLYRVIAPFYGVGKGANYKILHSEEELVEYEKKHGKQKDIDRFKGLGAMNEDLAEKYVMNPKYRKLEQIKIEDLEEMRKLFDTLLGKDLEGRRKLVREGI